MFRRRQLGAPKPGKAQDAVAKGARAAPTAPASRSKPAAASAPASTHATAARGAMSSGKQAYETRRAAEAGLTLDAWLARKARDAAREAAARTKETKAPPKKKGLIGRFLDRAHQPIQPKKG